MSKISRSPDRYTFQDQSGRYASDGRPAAGDPASGEFWRKVREDRMRQEDDPQWAVDNMEHDLRTTAWILDKVRANDSYAQNLYAAMCNNDFIKRDVYNVLTDKRWHCSWRHAGGIVADMRGEGDYIDWYCSGSAVDEDGALGYHIQPEGYVTEEIKADLGRLGWSVVDDNG